MSPSETSLGGPEERFPDTAWSTVLSGSDGDSPARQEALNRLFSRYWRPVYRVIRTAWRKSIEDAKDLAQDFFNYILEENLITKYRQEKGRFRSFLKGTLRNYLAETHRHQSRQKRGGGKIVLSLNTEDIERDNLGAPASATPDEIFDRQWANDVLRESITELKERLIEEKREVWYRAYEAYDLARERPTYDELADSLGVTAHQVKEYLTHCRGTLRELVAERIADGVTSREELVSELNDLFSV